MNATDKRALHFVFKIGNRRANYNFFVKLLGMKILRHEEFDEGCKAACNGPYDGRWSKTMIGYGKEDDHFVVELTYNYGIRSYPRGNDFKGITIHSPNVFNTFGRANYVQRRLDDVTIEVPSPDGYLFYVVNKEKTGDPVTQISLTSSDIDKTRNFWVDKLGMGVINAEHQRILMSYTTTGREQCNLEFVATDGLRVDHAAAFGRIAFSCPHRCLPDIEKKTRDSEGSVLKPLVSLDTPGKATVEVVILADPDGHEICFVGDEAFRELSRCDPNAEQLLIQAMDADKSDEWLSKHKQT